MKFIHTGDIHLGCVPDKGKPWSEARKNEIWNTFERMLAFARKKDVDLLLIAGDLFHRQPLLKELQEVNYLFSQLKHTRVVFIAGNHDYIKSGSFYEKFTWNPNVFFLKEKQLQSIYLKDLQTRIYGLSYFSREIREPLYHDLPSLTDNHIHILLAHGGDEKHIPYKKEILISSKFTYIALGHIHKPMVLEKNRIINAGAPEPLDINDTGEHGFYYCEGEKRSLRAEFISFSSRQYKTIRMGMEPAVTMAELKEKLRKEIEKEGKQNIFKVVVEGLRNPHLRLEEEQLLPLGNIVEIYDRTRPLYDYGKLQREHEKDVAGRFLKGFVKDGMIDENNKALQYGLGALLE